MSCIESKSSQTIKKEKNDCHYQQARRSIRRPIGTTQTCISARKLIRKHLFVWIHPKNVNSLFIRKRRLCQYFPSMAPISWDQIWLLHKSPLSWRWRWVYLNQTLDFLQKLRHSNKVRNSLHTQRKWASWMRMENNSHNKRSDANWQRLTQQLLGKSNRDCQLPSQPAINQEQEL